MPGMPEKTQTAREIFREMRASTHSYAKNFAVIGLLFSAVECTIETVRKSEMYSKLGKNGKVWGASLSWFGFGAIHVKNII